MAAVDVIVMGAAGRMGSTIARLAGEDSELNLVAVVERAGMENKVSGLDCEVSSDLPGVLSRHAKAVVVDFTAPEATVNTAGAAAESGNPMVIGTTGLSAEQQGVLAESAAKTPMLWAPNMSVGINVLLQVLPRLVEMLGPAYDLELSEIHHKHKKDAPSGTAVKLAQCLAEARGWEYDAVKRYCREGIIGARKPDELGVQTLRGGDVVGEHTVFFLGPGERIEVTHRAHSRETFAQGALRAAKWVAGQAPGRLYSIADMF